MMNFKFPNKCPNCDSKIMGGSDSCIFYECGGKISITGHYGDVITFVFKNCLADKKEEIKKRFKITKNKIIKRKK